MAKKKFSSGTSYKRFYERNKDDIEFMNLRKLYTKRCRFRKAYPRYWKILNIVFETWKETTYKIIDLRTRHDKIKLYYIFTIWKYYKTQQIYNRDLLESVLHSWKSYKIRPLLTISF